MKNIILSNAPIYNGNRGCVALTITAMSIIDRIMSETGEEYRLCLTDSNVKESGVYTYQTDGMSPVSFVPCDHFAIGLRPLIKNIFKTKKLGIKPIRQADFILDIGQGDSFSDIYGKQRFELINDIHYVSRLLDKPCCFLPQTIGPFKDEGMLKKAVKSLENASLVMTRDRQSFDYVKEIAPLQKNVHEYIDVAFYMPYKQMEFAKEFVHVGLNISGLLWNGGYTHNNQFGLKDDYQHLVRSILDYFLSMPNVVLHLIGHVVGRDRNVENDYAVNYDLWKEYRLNPRLVLAPLPLTPIDVKSYIAGMDFFMGARMHATIGAFSSGVPVVPMAYSRKFAGLFADTLQYPYLTDLKSESESEIIDVIKKSFADREALKEIIQERMSGVVREREALMIEDLKKFFGS